MTKLEIRRFAALLLGHSWVGKKRLDLVCFDFIEESGRIPENDIEKYHDSFSYAGNTDYEKLLRELSAIITDNVDCPIIELFDESGAEYVKKVGDKQTSDFARAIDFIEDIGNEKNKGIAFEEFCIQFLKDIGIKAASTRASNDKGIDILGSYETKTIEMVGKLIQNSEVFVLAQAKYFESAIDTPVIRKLVGDSLFIRFDDLEYVDIKHNAFHLMVFTKLGLTEPAKKFATRNKIEHFDSTRLAHLISNNPQIDWKCLSR